MYSHLTKCKYEHEFNLMSNSYQRKSFKKTTIYKNIKYLYFNPSYLI